MWSAECRASTPSRRAAIRRRVGRAPCPRAGSVVLRGGRRRSAGRRRGARCLGRSPRRAPGRRPVRRARSRSRRPSGTPSRSVTAWRTTARAAWRGLCRSARAAARGGGVEVAGHPAMQLIGEREQVRKSEAFQGRPVAVALRLQPRDDRERVNRAPTEVCQAQREPVHRVEAVAVTAVLVTGTRRHGSVTRMAVPGGERGYGHGGHEGHGVWPGKERWSAHAAKPVRSGDGCGGAVASATGTATVR